MDPFEFKKYGEDLYSTEMEIFSVGEWNDDTYTHKDLDEMVDAFEALKDKWKPTLKLGHKKQLTEQPALGYVDTLKRVGDKLIGYIVNIPKVVKQAIEGGLYKKRSAEIYWDYKEGDKIWKRCLKAVALLGASIPAVSTLKDIEKFFDGGEGEVREYEIDIFDMINKTEDGTEYPKEAFLYVPDPSKSSTWKLRIWENLSDKVTRAQLGRAAAAFSPGGFRGKKVQLPSDAIESVKNKLKALYEKLGVKNKDIPKYLLNQTEVHDMDLEQKLKEYEVVIEGLRTKIVEYEKAKETEKVAQLQKELDSKEVEIQELRAFKEEADTIKKERDDAIAEANRLAEDQRKNSVSTFVSAQGAKGDGKILPRDEKLVTDILLACPDKKEYSLDGEKEKVSLVDMVKKFISSLPKMVDLRQHSKADPGDDNHDTAKKEVETKVAEYRREHPEIAYYDCLKAVLDADLNLKERYHNESK